MVRFARLELVSLALLPALLATGPARAQDETALLVFGPIDGPTTIEPAQLNQAGKLFDRSFEPDQALHVSRVSPPAPDALSPYGAADVVRCPSNPLPVDELRAKTRDGMDQVDMLEYEDATKALKTSYRDLPCSDGFLNPQELSDLTMTLGILAHYQGKKEEALSWFRQTLAVNPKTPWDNAYPPDAQQMFTNAMQENLRKEDARLQLEEGQTAVSEVRINGATYDPITGPASLKPGRHLIQWRTVNGRIQSVSVELTEKQNAVLLSPKGLHKAVLAGENAGVGRAAVQERLGALASARRVQAVYVLGNGVAYRFDPATGNFDMQELKTPGSGRSTGKPSYAGPVLIGVGGGLAGAGLAMGGIAYQRGEQVREEYERSADLELRDQYESLRTQNQVGFALAGGGGAALAVGVILTITNPPPKKEQAGLPPGPFNNIQVFGLPTPGGATFGFSVRF